MLYTDSEMQAVEDDMWRRINGRFTSLYPLATLLHMEIGCRPDELICLKWSDVDFENGVLCIERQQVEIRKPKLNYLVVDYTKNEKGVSNGGRFVPFTDKAVIVLRKLREVKETQGLVSDWLFSDREGNVLRKKGYFDFQTGLKGKFPFVTKSSYVFRRGLSSRMEQAGIEVTVRAAVLGHSPDTNLHNYSFAVPEYLTKAKAALNGHI